MAKERSSRLADVVEAITILKAAEKEWPRGVSNKLIKEALERKEKELHEELFVLMTEKKGRKPPKGKKLSSQGDIVRP